MSPQTQNEMIEVIGKQIILKGLLDELNAAPFSQFLQMSLGECSSASIRGNTVVPLERTTVRLLF